MVSILKNSERSISVNYFHILLCSTNLGSFKEQKVAIQGIHKYFLVEKILPDLNIGSIILWT